MSNMSHSESYKSLHVTTSHMSHSESYESQWVMVSHMNHMSHGEPISSMLKYYGDRRKKQTALIEHGAAPLVKTYRA